MYKWKPIPGYEGIYEVDETGLIRSLSRLEKFRGVMRIRKPCLMKSYKRCGYWSLKLMKDAKGSTKMVHRMVAEAFIPNPEGKKYINHIDNNPDNNHMSNLQWCTQKENYAHSAKQGRNCFGEKHGCSKLTEADVRMIRQDDRSNAELGRVLSMTKEGIGHIRNFKTWRHII